MPVYNRESTIERAIESVLKQTYTNFELIIVNDKSTDNTLQVINRFIQKDIRVKYIDNKREKGVSGARNSALDISKGDYIAFLDSDDEWLEFHLKNSLDIMKESGCNFSTSLWWEKPQNKEPFKIFSENFAKQRFDKVISIAALRNCGNYFIWDKKLLLNYILSSGFYCFHINTLVFERNLLSEFDYFNERLKTNEDVDFIIRLIEKATSCFIKNYHYIYYQGNDNIYNFSSRFEGKLSSIVYNKEIVEKFNLCDEARIQMLIERKRFIRESKIITDKRDCIQKCNEKLGKQYFTIGLINQVYHPLKARKQVFISLFYYGNKKRFVCFIKLLKICRKSIVDTDDNELTFA